MNQLKIPWIYQDDWDLEWMANSAQFIDFLDQWCKDCGLKNYATGHTQIEVCITFRDEKDAVLFKLRWHNAEFA